MTNPAPDGVTAIPVPDGETDATFSFSRGDRLFATRRSLAERLEQQKVAIRLVADQLYHPTVPCDAVVRLGSLRVTSFMADDREVTVAVLQAGNTFVTRVDSAAGLRDANPPTAAPSRSDPRRSYLYRLTDVVLMALGDTELWILPAGALADDG